MIPLEAIDPSFLVSRWTGRLDTLLRMLHALTISEHPYAYLAATEPRRIRARA